MSKVTKVVVVERNKDFISYDLVDVEKFEGTPGQYFLTYGVLLDSFRKIMGKTLTIIDASITGSQNKAIKDLVRNVFSEEMHSSSEIAYDQNKLMATLNADAITEGIPETVTIEEALGVE